jgi:hypothetical protein
VTNAREAADPVDRLCESVALGQADDPLAPITVVVPSPFARVQLRRAVGGRQGICNVGFRTWPELTNELGRAAAGPSGRVPTPRMVNEALRQVLSSTSSPLDSFARSPLARAELASVLYELWRAGPSLLSRLAEHGGRAESLVRTLGAVDAHLAKHGFVDPGRLLELAATAPLDPGVIGAVVLWYPRPARARDQAVLDHLVHSGVPLTTIAATADRPGSVELVIECSDPDEEVRVITRRLLGAVEAGMPLWRQAIIHPPLDRYRRIISQQLTAANVASSGPSPMMLAQSVTGRTLVGLLELAQGDWRRVDVVRWLGAAPITSGPGGTRVPVHRWDDISARAGVVAGLEQWRHRLDRFAGGGAKRDPHVAHDEPEIHSARALVEFVERLAAELGTPGTRWSEWSAWALRLLDLYLAPEDRTEEWGPAELAAARAVRHVLVELGGLDDVAPSTDLIAFRHAVEAELASNPVRDDTQPGLWSRVRRRPGRSIPARSHPAELAHRRERDRRRAVADRRTTGGGAVGRPPERGRTGRGSRRGELAIRRPPNGSRERPLPVARPKRAPRGRVGRRDRALVPGRPERALCDVGPALGARPAAR